MEYVEMIIEEGYFLPPKCVLHAQKVIESVNDCRYPRT